jgi:hypothetical protein
LDTHPQRSAPEKLAAVGRHMTSLPFLIKIGIRMQRSGKEVLQNIADLDELPKSHKKLAVLFR